MDRIGATLGRFQVQWGIGFMLLLGVALAAIVGGFLASIAIYAVGELLGWSDGTARTVLLVSAFVWLPLAAGALRTYVRSITAYGTDRTAGQGKSVAN